MDKMHRPEVPPKKYVPMEVPKFGETVTVHGAKFVLRDDDGSSVFEGEILVERDSGTGHSTVVMSRGMAEEMLRVFFACLTKTDVTMKSSIVNALTADEEETIRRDVRKFVESVNSARPQDRQTQYEAWQYYLRGLYSTQRELASSECDKIVAELIKSGKYYMNAETLMSDTSNADEKGNDDTSFQEECAAADKEVEEHVRNQARTYADNIFGSTPYKKEYNKDGWMNYLDNLTTASREIARLSFQERMNLLTGKTAQTDNDGNYCDPSAQTSSIYTQFTGVEVDALLNQSRQERGVRGRFINEELKGDVDGDQETEA